MTNSWKKNSPIMNVDGRKEMIGYIIKTTHLTDKQALALYSAIDEFFIAQIERISRDLEKQESQLKQEDDHQYYSQDDIETGRRVVIKSEDTDTKQQLSLDDMALKPTRKPALQYSKNNSNKVNPIEIGR